MLRAALGLTCIILLSKNITLSLIAYILYIYKRIIRYHRSRHPMSYVKMIRYFNFSYFRVVCIESTTLSTLIKINVGLHIHFNYKYSIKVVICW
jgi:hypothetical protein